MVRGKPKKPCRPSRKRNTRAGRIWATWHVARLIDSAETTQYSKRRLALNAFERGIGIDQLADQFSRMFKKLEDETRHFYKDNVASARKNRATWAPMDEVNWREIAWNAAESIEMEIRAQRKNSKVPEFTEYDKGMLKSFGISSAPHTSV